MYVFPTRPGLPDGRLVVARAGLADAGPRHQPLRLAK